MALQENGRGTAPLPGPDVTTAVFEPAGWRLSWGAVFAGVIVSLVAHILLNLLGMGIGAASTEPRADNETVRTVGLLAGIWWSIAGIIAAGIGGWFAGRTLGAGDRDDGLIHGVLSWAATTLVIAFLLTSVMGGALAGALGRLGNDMGLMQQMGIQTNQNPNQPGQPAAGQPGAGQTAPGQPQAQPNPTHLQAPDARTAQRALSGSAFVSFIALLLGAIAAGFAGRWGVASAREALADD